MLVCGRTQVLHRQAVVWRPHVDREVLCPVSNLLDDLNTARASANLRNSLSLEVNAMLWPNSSVVDVALEVAQALERWSIPPRGKPNCRTQAMSEREVTHDQATPR